MTPLTLISKGVPLGYERRAAPAAEWDYPTLPENDNLLVKRGRGRGRFILTLSFAIQKIWNFKVKNNILT